VLRWLQRGEAPREGTTGRQFYIDAEKARSALAGRALILVWAGVADYSATALRVPERIEWDSLRRARRPR
jgi:hypothetical protein